MKIVLKTKGMHCISCEAVIKDALMEFDGVENVNVNYANERTEVEFDEKITSEKKIMKAIQEAGYEPEEWEEIKGGFLKKLFGG